MPPTPKEPFLDLDGGIASPESRGWRPPGGGVDVGAIGDFPPGSWRLNAGVRAIVARDARGLFYAYSALCTHERCLINEPDAMGVSSCVCHGSRFGGDGQVLGGPAVQRLQHHPVTILGGRVLVDPGARVADDVRTAVPSPDAGMRDVTDASDASDASDVPRDTGPDVRDVGVEVDPCTRGVDVGPVTMFAASSWTLLRAMGMIVGRDARGLFVYSALCTHSQCVVSVATDGAASCPCHGSRFDSNGAVTAGPAADDLNHYLLIVCAGRVRIDQGVIVAANTRTAAS